MTEASLANTSAVFTPKFCYAIQTKSERKNGGGLGRSEHSYWKHECIDRFMCRQLPVLMKRGPGCIIDMHAGDGRETPHPQPDFFAGGSLKTTPTLAIVAARRYGVDVILCESHKGRRDGLKAQFGHQAMVIGNHQELLAMDEKLSGYPWLLVINDPNGHGKHSVEVMQHLAGLVFMSDFVVVVNLQSIRRCLGLTNPEHHHPMVRAAYRSGIENQWMLEPEGWRARLNKRQVLASPPRHFSNAMDAQILLVSNFIPGGAQ